MDTEISLVIGAIASGLAACCVVLSLWSFVRLSRLEVLVSGLEDSLPPKKVQNLEQAFDALTDAFELMQKKNLEYKQSVHNSIQRMDQIMRRNESAASVVSPDGELNPDIVPGVLPPDLDTTPDDVGLSKQKALQLRWKKNRGLA